MRGRIAALVRAQISGEWLGERGRGLPVAPVLLQFSISAVLCGLARDLLPPYPYTLFALAIPLCLGALALFGDLAPLLRSDPAAEWIGAQPLRPIELRLARIIVLMFLLGFLALGALLPAALLAPTSMGLGGRLGILWSGMLQSAGLAAGLLALEVLCVRRAEGLLTLLHTGVFVGVLVGFLVGLGHLPELAQVTRPSGLLRALPSAWYAALPPASGAPLMRLWGWSAVAASLFILALAPFPPPPRVRRSGSALTFLLVPVRHLAARIWVRRSERASFEFLWDALPAERDFVTRAYPLLAVPLAFLLLGADGATREGEGLLAIALFTPAIYLPVLLLHVPATQTPAARWLLDTAPLDPRDEAAGARKALALRLLLPLFIGLGALATVRADLAFALRLVPVAFALTLLLQRLAWNAFVSRPPLSTPASELGSAWDDSGGGMLTLAVISCLLAIAAWRLVPGPAPAFALLVTALFLERLPVRGSDRPSGPR